MADRSLTVQGIRSMNGFISVEPAVVVITPLVDWHRDKRDMAGVEMAIDTPLWCYRFSLSNGQVATLIDMQAAAQAETDEQIRREQGHS